MDSEFVNVFEVGSTRSEIVLLFGKMQGTYSGQGQVGAQLRERIALNPFAAKRLLLQLNQVIQEIEMKSGSLEASSHALGGTVLRTVTPPPLASPPSVDRGIEGRTTLLFELVRGLQVEVGFEKSFKVVKGGLLSNRFLLGVSKKAIGERAEERLIEVCLLMGMPPPLLDVFKQYLPLGSYIHFGFEENEKTAIYKVYLEFWEKIREEIEKIGGRPGPSLLHLGLKWDIFDPSKHSLTRYTWHPWLRASEIRQKVCSIIDGKSDNPAHQAVDALLSLGLARVPYRDLLFLEVKEEGNPRRSFDINVYRANLQVREVYPLLSMLCRRHSISFEAFHSLYQGIKESRLGHLAAGLDREGSDFFTIYYGVEGMFGEREKRTLSDDRGVIISKEFGTPPRRRRLARIEETDDKAHHLFYLVRSLGLPGGWEHSFKFLERMVLADRFLYGVQRLPEKPGQDESILEICAQIDMPEDYREMFRAELHQAKMVLFGFEKNEKASIYKAYLEFTGRLAEALKVDPRPESVVIYSGFKWDASDNSRKVIAEYRAYPLFRAEDVAIRIATSFYGGLRNDPYSIVDDLLDLAGTRTQPGELLYFEASEQGNRRSSFDINLYRANLQMAEIYPLLLRTVRHYSIELEKFEELYQGVKGEKLGHLSGGIDREGRDFLTFYFSPRGSSRQAGPR